LRLTTITWNPPTATRIEPFFQVEPFAMDLWREELPEFFPARVKPEQIDSEFYFGGLYQKIVLSL